MPKKSEKIPDFRDLCYETIELLNNFIDEPSKYNDKKAWKGFKDLIRLVEKISSESDIKDEFDELKQFRIDIGRLRTERNSSEKANLPQDASKTQSVIQSNCQELIEIIKKIQKKVDEVEPPPLPDLETVIDEELFRAQEMREACNEIQEIKNYLEEAKIKNPKINTEWENEHEKLSSLCSEFGQTDTKWKFVKSIRKKISDQDFQERATELRGIINRLGVQFDDFKKVNLQKLKRKVAKLKIRNKKMVYCEKCGAIRGKPSVCFDTEHSWVYKTAPSSCEYCGVGHTGKMPIKCEMSKNGNNHKFVSVYLNK